MTFCSHVLTTSTELMCTRYIHPVYPAKPSNTDNTDKSNFWRKNKLKTATFCHPCWDGRQRKAFLSQARIKQADKPSINSLSGSQVNAGEDGHANCHISQTISMEWKQRKQLPKTRTADVRQRPAQRGTPSLNPLSRQIRTDYSDVVLCKTWDKRQLQQILLFGSHDSVLNLLYGNSADTTTAFVMLIYPLTAFSVNHNLFHVSVEESGIHPGQVARAHVAFSHACGWLRGGGWKRNTIF